MAELLRLESTRLYGSNSSGCIWSVFHMFDSYRRRGTKRMLSYQSLGDHQYGVATDILMVNETGGEDTVANKEANNIVETKASNMNKSSGKTRILNFISIKLLKRQKHKGKLSHSSHQLTPTLSVHHSESSDYITPGESSQITSDSEASSSTGLDDTDSLPISDCHESPAMNGLHEQRAFDEQGNHLLDEHVILKEKLFEARDALLKQKDFDPKGLTVEFSLLSRDFLDTLHLLNANREALYNGCKDQSSFAGSDMGRPAKARALNRSVSLTGLDLSGNAAAGIFVPSREQMEGGSSINQGFLSGSHELRKLGESRSVLSRLRELKERLKGVIVENKKELHRISMDRILDRVPSGRKRLEDEEDDKLGLRAGLKINRLAPGSSIGKSVPNGVQRSRSLTESLDRYSQLLGSISASEARKAPERSNSIREGRSLLQGKLPKTHRRAPSNPEFLSSYSFSKDVQSEASIAFQSSKNLELHGSDLETTDGGSDKLDEDLVMQPVAEEIAYEKEESLESTIVSNECLQFFKKLDEQNDSFDKQDSQIEDEPSVEPEKASPISVLDPDIEEPLSPLKFTLMEGSDPHEEQPPSPKAQKELTNLNIYEETSTGTGDQANDSFLDEEQDAARFNYVKHVLSKTGYEALLCEEDDSSIDIEAATSHMLCGMPFEAQLLYDLINEVLFEIYEYSTAPCSWLSRFHSKIRSMPVGSYLVEEVWAEIRWHLSSPQGLDAMADKILARNFAKGDDWMKLYRDAECFGLLLEQLILDDLVDEAVLDIDEL